MTWMYIQSRYMVELESLTSITELKVLNMPYLYDAAGIACRDCATVSHTCELLL